MATHFVYLHTIRFNYLYMCLVNFFFNSVNNF